MRAAAVLAACLLFAGCSGGGGSAHRGGAPAKVSYLVNVEGAPAPMRTSSSGAPMMGLSVSGNITNTGTAPLPCSPSQFVLMRAGSDITPTSAFCGVPSIAPQHSAYFHATFLAPPSGALTLRFEHGDGTYETQRIAVSAG